MCGIAGIYRRSGDGAGDAAVMKEMLAALVRRGPDGEGIESHGPLTLGHRRLSILDLSPAGRQPMANAGARLSVSFNGEIYNFRELQAELGLADGELRSGTDTEILLHAWERFGEGALELLAGQFAFALYDHAQRRLWLARDRFGEKPLYFHADERALTFASSIAALLRAPWVPRRLSQESLAEYASLRYVVAPRTVLEGVKKLPAGHLLVADPQGNRTRCWYEPRFRPVGQRSRGELVEEFGALLVQASRRCLVSDVPVGLLLSDGIDSNSIHAALGLAGRSIPAFTYRMNAARGSASTVVDEGDARSIDVHVTPSERLAQVVPVFSSFTEPVGDGASLATWLLIRKARSEATVFLCGHGADEILGGYRLSQDRFRLACLRHLTWVPGVMYAASDRYLHGGEGLAHRRRALNAAAPWEVPGAARYLVHRPLPRSEVQALFHPRPLPEAYLATIDSLYAACSPDACDLDRIQEVMIRTFLAENILSFADSVAMDSSAELRMPFLDRDLTDFAFSLEREARVSRWPGRANTKRILRWWGEPHVRPATLARKKRTFHYGSLRELLASDGELVRGWILGSRALNEALPGLEAWVAHPPEFFHGSWEGTLWALLTLGIWCRAVGLDEPSSAG